MGKNYTARASVSQFETALTALKEKILINRNYNSYWERKKIIKLGMEIGMGVDNIVAKLEKAGI